MCAQNRSRTEIIKRSEVVWFHSPSIGNLSNDLFIKNVIERDSIEAQYKLLVVPENSLLTNGQKEIVDHMVADGKAI